MKDQCEIQQQISKMKVWSVKVWTELLWRDLKRAIHAENEWCVWIKAIFQRRVGPHQHPSDFFKASYNKLIWQIKKDITQWDILTLSLLGAAKVVRMNLFCLLFLFQTLPLRVPLSTFDILNTQISTFIWQKKRRRIRLGTLPGAAELRNDQKSWSR